MNHHTANDCQETLQRLNAYIDGELDPSLCSDLEAHIEACVDCRIVLNTIQKTIQLCQNDGEQTTLPPGARERLMVSLGLENEQEQKK